MRGIHSRCDRRRFLQVLAAALPLASGATARANPASGPGPGPAPALVVLIDGSIEMPQALIRGEQVIGGLQHDLATEIGRRLGRAVKFRLVPRRRVAALLLAGDEADMICYYVPEWLPGALRWSRPFVDDGDLLITAARVPAPARLQDLAGQSIGTIAGFYYPEATAALGNRFVRDDGPNLGSSLRKMEAGRTDHALIGRTTFDYLKRRGQVPLEVHPPLSVSQVRTRCALSPHTRLPLAELDAAIQALQADGGLTDILKRYR